MTWRGCHAGRFRKGGLWHFCTRPATGPIDLTVEGAPNVSSEALDAGTTTETIDVDVCDAHHAAIQARPGAWSIDTENEPPRIFALATVPMKEGQS